MLNDNSRRHRPQAAVNLPLELKYEIVSYLDAQSLFAITQTSKALSAEAERYLYRDVQLDRDDQIESFHHSLVRDPRRSKRVQTCNIINFSPHNHPLVHHVLKAMSNLRSLAILPAVSDLEFSPGWDALLTDCDFQLLEFITSFDCDRALADFLVTQTNIELYIHSGYTPTNSANVFHDPLVLPSLKRFHGNVMDLNIIIPQRPVTSVTVQESVATIGLSLFVLRPLRDSKGPIEHLSLSLMDTVRPTTLDLIQSHTPRLSKLELSAPRPAISSTGSTPEMQWTTSLATFKYLEHFSFETSSPLEGDPSPISLEQQETMAQAWFAASKCLHTIDFTSEIVCDEEDEVQMQSAVQSVDRWTCGAGNMLGYEIIQRPISSNGWPMLV